MVRSSTFEQVGHTAADLESPEQTEIHRCAVKAATNGAEANKEGSETRRGGTDSLPSSRWISVACISVGLGRHLEPGPQAAQLSPTGRHPSIRGRARRPRPARCTREEHQSQSSDNSCCPTLCLSTCLTSVSIALSTPHASRWSLDPRSASQSAAGR